MFSRRKIAVELTEKCVENEKLTLPAPNPSIYIRKKNPPLSQNKYNKKN